MFKNYLKITFRSLWKNKSYSLINIFGLSVGLTVCLLIFLFIRYELSFDTFHKNSKRIYRVVTTWKYSGRVEYSQGTPFPLAAALRQDFTGIQTVAAVIRTGSQITVPGKNEGAPMQFDESGNIFVTDPEFYQIFSFPWLAGNPKTALSEPNTVALTRSEANKLFGDWHRAIGKSILIDNSTWLKVTGIMRDIPKNTDLPVKVAVSYTTFTDNIYKNWQFVSTESHCYILLKPHVSIAQLASQLPVFIKKYYPDNSVRTGAWGFAFQRLSNIHFNTRYGSYGHQIDPAELVTLALVGLFILLIGCINFINMSTAQASRRAKEVGIRKVMGSRRKNLMFQFMGESMLITLIAMLAACLFSNMALPWLNHLFKQPLSFEIFKYPGILFFLMAAVLVTGLLAGIYPALIMSGFNPVTALKSKVTSSGSHLLRKALIVFQFTVTLVLLICMWILIKQIDFFRHKPMGFNQSAISLVSMPDDSASMANYSTFKETLAQVPGIESMSFCYDPPSSMKINTHYFSYNSEQKEPFTIDMKYADTGYFRTFGLQIAAGRIFYPGDTIKEVVVNQTLLRKLGILHPRKAIGKHLVIDNQKVTITGVVKDFVNFSLKEKISPIVIAPDKNEYGTIALKLNSRHIGLTMQNIKSAFNHLFPAYVFEYHFFDKQIANYYMTEDRLAKLFKIFTGVAVLISVAGLLSLLSFITAQRTKEMAVRKILGASLKDIMQLIGKDFIILTMVANVIAVPIAVIFAGKWLNGFAYSIHIPVIPFVLTFFLSVVLTILIVGFQVIRIAGSNPVNGLKYE